MENKLMDRTENEKEVGKELIVKNEVFSAKTVQTIPKSGLNKKIPWKNNHDWQSHFGCKKSVNEEKETEKQLKSTELSSLEPLSVIPNYFYKSQPLPSNVPSDVPQHVHSDVPLLPSDVPPHVHSDVPPHVHSDVPPHVHSDVPPLPSDVPPHVHSDVPLLPSDVPPHVHSDVPLLPSDVPPHVHSDVPPLPLDMPPHVPSSVPPYVYSHVPWDFPPHVPSNAPPPQFGYLAPQFPPTTQPFTSKFSYVVVYEKFCVKCGEAGHEASLCMRYKTILCKYWNEGRCLRINCAFAHGSWELRRPWKSKCSNVVLVAPNTFAVLGCGDRNTHTFAQCTKLNIFGLNVTQPKPLFIEENLVEENNSEIQLGNDSQDSQDSHGQSLKQAKNKRDVPVDVPVDAPVDENVNLDVKKTSN
jgi:hypothetical protein